MGESFCVRCGADLPHEHAEWPCPACAIEGAATPISRLTDQPDLASQTGGGIGVSPEWEPWLESGQRFGPYRIARLIGRGGMGEVYEAEHEAQGRRLALKLLHHRLRRPEDRARFFREGQLAACINHPNSVYIFGSEEIAGMPVITMELLPGGTLSDRVRTDGPLPPTQAINVMLQVIAGLEAAHTIGILHRDIKPSNCFVDHDGVAKIGDFGLSISTASLPSESPSERGSFVGTPAFASPEQRRGEPLDVRSDIYAVGATLHYMLTGEPPLEATDLRAGPGSEAAPRARHLWRSIPPGFEHLLRRCLDHRPESRFPSYATLAHALVALRPLAAVPAGVGMRLAAGLLDVVVLVPIMAGLLATAVGRGVVTTSGPALVVAVMVPLSVYWGLCEGCWGTAFGKRACGLRVVTTDGLAPSFRNALARSTILGLFLAFVILAATSSMAVRWVPGWPATVVMIGLVLGGWFSGAHPRRSGVAWHDMLTGTRVVARTDVVARINGGPAAGPIRIVDPGAARVGPYEVLATVGPTGDGDLVLGRDPRLQRLVWLHVVGADDPSVSRVVRERRRATSLRWLNGQRTSETGWDAYECPSGMPFSSMVVPQAWQAVRQWLLDLASELDARLEEGSADTPGLNRLWMTSTGHAKLLDFSAPGEISNDKAEPLTVGSAQHWLHDVARRALGGGRTPPLPLSGSMLLHSLARAEFTRVSEVVRILTALRTLPDHVTVTRRGVVLAIGGLATLAGVWVFGTLAAGLGPSLPRAALLGCAIAAVLAAIVFRGGFWLHAFGIAVVTADGRPVSRARAAGRALIAWSWVPATVLAIVYAWDGLHLAVSALAVTGFLWTADQPTRGPHDRLAGTYLVPK